jgi:hypothetical protein
VRHQLDRDLVDRIDEALERTYQLHVLLPDFRLNLQLLRP